MSTTFQDIISTFIRFFNLINFGTLLLLIVQFTHFAPFVAGGKPVKHDYCVIGAGPGGLQLGYFLHQKQRDYVIFERNSVAGSFFQKYPRHRQLISINKRHTGSTNQEMNFRHDWNSLISNDPELVLGRYSKDYFPQADHLVEYYNDYQQTLGLKVQFNTSISDIKRKNRDILEKHDGDACTWRMTDQNDQKYCCKYTIMATGISKLVKVDVPGAELLDTYDTVPIDGAAFEGQRVWVIGSGNAGTEVAKVAYGHAAYVHLSGKSRAKFSWETHYVGNIRAVNNELFDAYMLKSLDGYFEMDMKLVSFRKNWDGKIQVVGPQGALNTESGVFREGYDRVVACTGFQWDPEVLARKSRVRSVLNDKYPAMQDSFQSFLIPDLWFTGTLVHGLDYKKAAGGFIHGYRYSARILSRIMDWKYHGERWPFQRESLEQLTSHIMKRANEASGIYQMFTVYCDVVIVHRNKFRFTYLEEFPIRLLPRLTEITGHKVRPNSDFIVTLSMRYGANFSIAGMDHFGLRVTTQLNKAQESNFLHPVLQFFTELPPKNSDLKYQVWENIYREEMAGIHHVIEDFTIVFNCYKHHIAGVRNFLEFHLGTNLKPQSKEQCMSAALFRQFDNVDQLPAACQQYLSLAKQS